MAQTDHQHLVDAVDLFLEGSPRARLRHQAHAVDRASAGQRRVDASDAPGVAEPAGGGDLRGPPLPCGRLGGGHRDAQNGLDCDRVGRHLLPVDREPVAAEHRRHQRGDPVVLGRGKADPEVGSEGLGHLGAEPVGHAPAGDAVEDLALQVALADGVVARGGARLPPRGLGREVGGHGFEVVELLGGDGRVEAGHAGGVGHHVAHQHALLAVLGELGPVLRHGGVEVELAPVGQHQHAGGRHGLGGGVDVDDGVALPGYALGVGVAAPDVDDELAVDGHRRSRADLQPVGEVGLERVLDRFEPGLACPIDLHAPMMARPEPVC